MTAQSVRKVEPASADVEADGREEPNPGAGRGKGLCCTQGEPRKEAECSMGPPRYRRECMQCVWRSDEATDTAQGIEAGRTMVAR